MTNKGIIQIHGKDYMTVARRVELAHEDGLEEIITEVLTHEPVVIKALVRTKKGTFSGISSANPLKSIEKSNPYEVAETSAVGRALGFAGYGLIEGIASADEMIKSDNGKFSEDMIDRDAFQEKLTTQCEHCGTTNKYHRKDCPNFGT